MAGAPFGTGQLRAREKVRVSKAFSLTRRGVAALSVGLLVGLLPARLASEALTLTAYYPSPYGVYQRLRSTQDAYLAYQSGRVGVGLTNPGSKLGVAGGVAVGSGYANRTAPTNGMIVQGNVGIGLSNPNSNYRLVVTGRVGVATTGGGAWSSADAPYTFIVNGKSRFRDYIRVPSNGCTYTSFSSNGWHNCGGSRYATWLPGVYQNGRMYMPIPNVMFKGPGGPFVGDMGSSGGFYCCNK